VCDDLQITVEHGRISKCQGACHLAEPWFLGQDHDRPPVASIEGQAVPLEAAVRRAAGFLERPFDRPREELFSLINRV
jgi:formylmethanofuran dehydrogenase subunit B